MNSAVGQRGEYAMDMDHCLAVPVAGDVAGQGRHLHLLVQPQQLVGFPVGIEPADLRRAQRAQGREMGDGDMVRLGELRQSGDDRVALGKDQLEMPGLGIQFGGFQARRHARLRHGRPHIFGGGGSDLRAGGRGKCRQHQGRRAQCDSDPAPCHARHRGWLGLGLSPSRLFMPICGKTASRVTMPPPA